MEPRLLHLKELQSLHFLLQQFYRNRWIHQLIQCANKSGKHWQKGKMLSKLQQLLTNKDCKKHQSLLTKYVQAAKRFLWASTELKPEAGLCKYLVAPEKVIERRFKNLLPNDAPRNSVGNGHF